ncbi:MAG: MarR family winged helix-turn-helix transcriptional regulator [Jatrophihabitans sp.]
MIDVAEAPAVRRDDVADLADNFVGLVRTFTKARSRWLAAAAHDVEWSAHVLLKCVRHEGPMRAGALADCVHSDPSTVSRQVAALVKDGLLERRADPDDGRASLLVCTPQADAVLCDHDELRINHFAQMLVGWSRDDVTQLSALLRRFTDAYDAANSELINERVATKPARAGSTD